MRRIKHFNLLMILTLICSIFTFTIKVNALASAAVGFSGNSTVRVGDQITITMYVSNVTDTTGGVVSVGGNLSFDSSYLQYVSGTGVTSPYTFQINTGANYIIAGLDTTLSNGITASGQTKVFTFVFKALKEGSTQVTLTNVKLSDTAKKISSTVTPKTITITGDTPDEPVVSNKSNDATLKSLSASGYTLSPLFSPNTTAYTIKVPNDATSIKLTGVVNHSKATVTGLGDITLSGDKTTATIKVTAEDGTVKTYTVNIEKEVKEEVKKDSDATLKSLYISGYTLSPTFKSNINTYSMKVGNNITALNVDAIANSTKAKVQISGNSGWKEGVNVVSIKVTAEDGTVNTYIVNVTRASKNNDVTPVTKSSDNYLKSLIINSSHDMKPEFNRNFASYDVTVPYEVEKLDLSYVTNDPKAKVEINGNSNFKVGEVNTIEIAVTAEDGTKRYYVLNVTRSSQGSDTDLEDLIIKDGELSPKFDPDVLDYTIDVDGDTDELDITAIPKTEGSKVEIIGNENLKKGQNTVLVKVTDKNGFSKYYTITVNKAKKENKILGLTPIQFGIISGIIGLLLLLLLLLLFRKKKEDEEKEQKVVTPIIEVKPEFNFSSKNTSDDDVVHGNLNQNSDLIETSKHRAIEGKYETYDPYDEVVTKDELVDAIEEATKTKDTSKLKILLEQEALNRKKEELKKKEQEENDDWR